LKSGIIIYKFGRIVPAAIGGSNNPRQPVREKAAILHREWRQKLECNKKYKPKCHSKVSLFQYVPFFFYQLIFSQYFITNAYDLCVHFFCTY